MTIPISLPIYAEDFYSDTAIQNPYPVYALLRAMGPVVYLKQHDVYALPRYAEVASVLRQPKRFVSSRGVSLNDKVNALLAGSTLNSDPPEHDATRSVTAPPLLPGALEAIAPRIRQAADTLVAELTERRRFDAVSDFAQHLPLSIVAERVGLPAEGCERMLTWASATFNLFGPENERAKAAFADLRDLKAFLDEYGTPDKLKPGGWAHRIFEVGAERVFPYATCAHLMRDCINPSLDTTIAATAQAIKFFADQPEQWALIRKRPELIPNAVEEVVRLATPIRAWASLPVVVEPDAAGATLASEQASAADGPLRVTATAWVFCSTQNRVVGRPRFTLTFRRGRRSRSAGRAAPVCGRGRWHAGPPRPGTDRHREGQQPQDHGVLFAVEDASTGAGPVVPQAEGCEALTKEKT